MADILPTTFGEVAKYFTSAKHFKTGEPITLFCKGAEDFQIAGGFLLPTNQVFLDRFNANFIKGRIERISNGNIIAASEVDDDNKVTSTQYNGIIGPGGTPVTGLIKDTCFISTNIPNINYDNTAKKPYNIINYGGKKIASIHLRGDGPKKPKVKQIPAQSIEEFLRTEFDTFGIGPDIDVICGDTNITISKCTEKNTREEIGKKISNALSAIFPGTNWLVIMSELEISKIRMGSFLRNPQVEKSKIPTPGDNGEADGTIIAIKIPTLVTSEYIIDQKFPVHYSVYLGNTTLKKGITDQKTYFSFDTANDKCMNENNQLTDAIFLDHSVLQISNKLLFELMGLPAVEVQRNSNLIVLNLGSMQNSGQKSWKLQYAKYQPYIEQLDRTVYDYIKRPNTTNHKLPKYDMIIGSGMKDPEGKTGTADKIPIVISQPELDKICSVIQGVVALFEAANGGEIDEVEFKQLMHELIKPPSQPTRIVENNLPFENNKNKPPVLRNLQVENIDFSIPSNGGKRSYAKKNRKARKTRKGKKSRKN